MISISLLTSTSVLFLYLVSLCHWCKDFLWW